MHRQALEVIKLFAAAIVLAIWAVVRFAGVLHGDFWNGVFLTILVMGVVISERERSKLRKEHRAWPITH